MSHTPKISERLNEYAAKSPTRRSVDEGDDLMREAADQIEALEAALRRIEEMSRGWVANEAAKILGREAKAAIAKAEARQ